MLDAFLFIMPAVFLEGAGVAGVAGQLLPMLAIALVTSTAAGWMFRRRTE